MKGNERVLIRQIVVFFLIVLSFGCSDLIPSSGQLFSSTDKILASAEDIFSPLTLEKKPEIGGIVEGFYGGVAVDEPRAAIIGREVLASGGNAFDAATAIYFALSVTLPSSAGLAGGGVCAVHPAKDGKNEYLQFLPHASKQLISVSGRPSAVPGNARGFFLLHSRYGRVPWQQLLSPAEKLARFGYRISRAFAIDLARVAPALIADKEAKKIFLRENGEPFVEGETVKQIDYANVLSRIRMRGVGEFYLGSYASTIANAFRQAGGTLDAAELRNFKPQWVAPISIDGPHRTKILFAPPPNAAGSITAQIVAMAKQLNIKKFKEIDRYHILAAASKRAISYRENWMQPDGYSTVKTAEILSPKTILSLTDSINLKQAIPAEKLSPAPAALPETSSAATFAVIDREGGAVACAVTMNNLFGTGKVAPGLGILLAAAPDSKGRGYRSLAPSLIVHKDRTAIFMAVSGSGGITLPSVLAKIISRVSLGINNFEQAMRVPRVHHGGNPDVIYVEQNMNSAIVDGLRKRGHSVSVSTTLGRINGLFCSGGLPAPRDLAPGCSFLSDPRGHGLALSND